MGIWGKSWWRDLSGFPKSLVPPVKLTRNREFLNQRAYPVMKEAKEFLLDYLMLDDRKLLETSDDRRAVRQYKFAKVLLKFSGHRPMRNDSLNSKTTK